MVEPDGAGVAHRGAQHVAIRRKRLLLEACGIEAGEAPGLAGGVERIGRRADAEMAGDRDLLVPGIEAVGLHADRDVEIEPDLHAELLRQIGGGAQLPVGGPLHEFDELDFAGVLALAQGSASGIVRLPPLLPAIPTTACRICAAAPRSRQSATARCRARRGICQNPAGGPAWRWP